MEPEVNPPAAVAHRRWFMLKANSQAPACAIDEKSRWTIPWQHDARIGHLPRPNLRIATDCGQLI